MKRIFLLLVVIVAASAVTPVFAQSSGEFRSDVKGPPYPWTNLNFSNEPGTLRFAIVSDRAGWPRAGVLERAVDVLNRLQPEFVISIGDQADTPDDETSVPEFDREHNFLDGIVGKLTMPYFYVAGNHDIYNALAARQYHKRRGRPYYSFVYKNVLFLVLCTEDPPPDQISTRQIAYIQKTLRANPSVRWTFVFLHRPWFSPKEKNHTIWKKMESMLSDRPHTVFAGHWHHYEPYTKNGRKYIVLATTGGDIRRKAPQDTIFDEIVWVTLREKGKEPAITNLTLKGMLPWDFRTPISLDEKDNRQKRNPKERTPERKTKAAPKQGSPPRQSTSRK
ncbi:MAG: metallophosphoesterase [Phycisphaerae bacterium]|nr:metallophosphoesterase [Phycisphaerae bacterium]